MAENFKLPQNFEALENRGYYIYARYTPYANIDEYALLDHVSAYRRICGSSGYPFIFDSRDLTITITHEAREFIAKSSKDGVMLATAFIVNTKPTQLMINFFIKFNRPNIPFRLFSTIEEAEQWVKQFKVTKLS